MYTTKLILTAVAAALTVTALPTDITANSTIESRDAHKKHHHHHHHHGHHDAFELHVWNNCAWTKEVGLYQITSDFNMVHHGKSVNIGQGNTHVFHPSFHATGMRLSGHAEWGTAGQWNPQALFEFGHSAYAGTEGTAYDLSVMQGSDGNIGIGVYPKNDKCESKTCWPDYCPPDQGWTNPDQTSIGSPADTVCYQGKTNFKVVFCP